MAKSSRRRSRGYIKPQEARFIELTLQSGSAVAKKQALQSLCGLLRAGFLLSAPMVLKGLIFLCLSDSDPKVRRWAFNALAQLGTSGDVALIMPMLEKSRGDADIFEAGLTALAHILPKDQTPSILAAWDVPMSSATIMALAQQSSDFEAELMSVTLDIDNASVNELRSATLLVGLQRAPESLFSRHHPVTDVVGVLNGHDDPIVAQYSFWAGAEHPSLGLADMRVSPQNFPSLRPNVQGWALRVLTQDRAASQKHYDVIVGASQHDDYAVREGLAIGIRGLYYDSLDTMVLDWYFDNEEDAPIKERLLEHMSAQALNSVGYREQVTSAYRETGPGSPRRARLESVCGSDELALLFRSIELQTDDPDLFNHIARPAMNTTNNQTFNAQNITGVSGSGVGNQGEVRIVSLTEAQSRATPALSKIDEQLEQADISPAVAEGKSLVADAMKAPTKSNVEKVLAWLNSFKAGGQAIAGILKSGDTISSELHHIIPHLPNHF